MNGRERLAAVFNGRIPDKVPHMELVFQLKEEAFQTRNVSVSRWGQEPGEVTTHFVLTADDTTLHNSTNVIKYNH